MGGARGLRRGWRAALDSQASGTTLVDQDGDARATEIGAMSPEGVSKKRLKTINDHILQRRQRGELYRQLPELLRTR